MSDFTKKGTVKETESLKESKDLDWIKDISDKLPGMSNREQISLNDFLLDVARDNSNFLEFLEDEEFLRPSEEYRQSMTPEEYDDFGLTEWREEKWMEEGNSEWDRDPELYYFEIKDAIEYTDGKWVLEKYNTMDYDLESSSFTDSFIMKRKSDGRYFCLKFYGTTYDGIENNEDYLYEVFPQKVTKTVYESRLIKKTLREGEFDWIKEIPGTKGYGEKYKYFEIIACYGVDYETEECDDEYSHFVKIPEGEVEEIWDGHIGYMGGPGDEGEAVISYAIDNNLIPPRELEEIIMFQGVVEVSGVRFEEEVGMPDDLNESDFDWASGFEWSEEMLNSMLTDCRSLRVANFNIQTNSPYMSAGGPSVMFLTRCKEWWDYFYQVPLRDDGRGPAEWFTPEHYNEGRYGIVWHHRWGENQEEPTIEMLDDEYTSAITARWDWGLERQLNGTNPSEAWFVVDENNKPIYDLIPSNVQEYAKIYEKEFFGDKLNESIDLDWVKKQEPEKEMKKNKRYVIDVGHLRPDTPISISPTSPNYADLTKQDILNKLGNLGYDVEGVDVDSAKYFFVEPSEDAGYWDDAVWVSQGYWVDYNDDNTEDPTYNGKYEMIDVDEFMFLVDNNLISESSDFDWIKEIKPTMNVCEAYGALKVGDEIIIDEIDSWEDNPNQWDGWGDEIQTFHNVKAKVLALDTCDNIHRGNTSTDNTILVSIEQDDYYGFDDLWVDDFVGTLPSQCQKDNCMFLICNKYEKEYQIQLIEPSLNEIDKKDGLEWIKDTGLGKVDLRNCEPGDMLVTRSGKAVTYVRPIPEIEYMDHEIRYPNGASGSRTHDGYVFNQNRLDSDEDIIAILDDKFVDQIVGPTKPITEAAGISFESRKWGEIISNEVMNNPNEKKRLIIDGYDHPEAFDGFPIDYIIIDFYDKLTGYGQEHSGYDKDGNYVVLLYIQPKLLQGQGGYSLKSVLNHEMKHAWDDYNRLSKGLPSIDNTKETKELYNKDFILMLSDQNVIGPIKEVLKYYYYLSKLETTAYLENVYDENPVYEKIVREIASKDFESFKERFDLEVNWHLMNTAYDIPFLKKFKSPKDFIDYSSEELRSKAVKMIKKINKMRYIHQK